MAMSSSCASGNHNNGLVGSVKLYLRDGNILTLLPNSE